MRKEGKAFKLKFITVTAAVLLLLTLTLAGCGKDSDTSSRHDALNQNGDISAKPAQTQQKVTLYFSDDQAMRLVPEERTVTKGDEALEAVIIGELINGPQKDNLEQTIPTGTKLLSVSVVDGVAYVNFSKEFQTKHWGGSSGETMTLYSVVNSLAKLPGIEKVQFLLEGDKEESILNGNMDTTVPLAPDYSLGDE
ncbi:GerMN domain-containing protein [Desulfoscipio sp. XC116]|uniref:GerMN domain-containing protein n=1 Tax=Desulfoscipio sp. XC116 TaxID=3144975 RepID=UPI00325B5FFF